MISKTLQMEGYFLSGTLEATRTPDPQLRRLLLYPTELQAHVSAINILNKSLLLCKFFNGVYCIKPKPHLLGVAVIILPLSLLLED